MLSLAALTLFLVPTTPDFTQEAQRLAAPSGGAAESTDPRTPIDAVHTPGDANSVFRIAAPGSYYLPADARGQAGKAGIEIAASNVTIDLMGFSLRGVNASLDGIALDGDHDRIAIENGAITGFGGDGVGLYQAEAVRLERLVASQNGDDGLAAGAGSHVSRCTVMANAGKEIACLRNAIVADCIALQNGGIGIWSLLASRVERCASAENGAAGVSLGSGSTVMDSRAYLNASHGFSLGTDTRAQGCSASGNGDCGFDGISAAVLDCSSTSNASFGIQVKHWSLVRGNRVRNNGSVGTGGGIRVTHDHTLVEDNTSTDHDFAGYSIEGANNAVRRNTAADNGLNWFVAANNACRVLVAAQGAGIFGDAGGVALGSSDPNANYTY